MVRSGRCQPHLSHAAWLGEELSGEEREGLLASLPEGSYAYERSGGVPWWYVAVGKTVQPVWRAGEEDHE